MGFFDYITYPFSLLMYFLYTLTSNYGLSIILFALIVKLVLLPFGAKSKKSMMRTAQFTPKLKELEKKYEGNKAKYNEEAAKLYKEEGIKPLGGCLWSLLPLPLLFALYNVVRQPFKLIMRLSDEQYHYLLDKVFPNLNMVIEGGTEIDYAQRLHERFGDVGTELSKHTDEIAGTINASLINMDFSFLGINLAAIPRWDFFMNMQGDLWPQLGLFLIPVISGIMAYISSRVSQKMSGQQTEAAGGMKGMTIMMPFISLIFGFSLPAAMGIYWIANSILSMAQDICLTMYYNKKLEAEKLAREERFRQRDLELEKKRQETERLRAENATVVNPNTSRRKKQKQDRIESERKAAEWSATHGETKKARQKTDNLSQVGERQFARGRAYDPKRFDKDYVQPEETDEDTAFIDDTLLVEGYDTEDETETLSENSSDSEIVTGDDADGTKTV